MWKQSKAMHNHSLTVYSKIFKKINDSFLFYFLNLQIIKRNLHNSTFLNSHVS